MTLTKLILILNKRGYKILLSNNINSKSKQPKIKSTWWTNWLLGRKETNFNMNISFKYAKVIQLRNYIKTMRRNSFNLPDNVHMLHHQVQFHMTAQEPHQWASVCMISSPYLGVWEIQGPTITTAFIEVLVRNSEPAANWEYDMNTWLYWKL